MKLILCALSLLASATITAQAAELNHTICKVQEYEADGEDNQSKFMSETVLEFNFASPYEMVGSKEVASKKYPGLKVELYWGGQGRGKNITHIVQGITFRDETRKISVVDDKLHSFVRDGEVLRMPAATVYKLYNMETGNGLDRLTVDCYTNQSKL
ncbi:MAG: hypothetical protein EOP11_23500 [Proteobacteria bacterium]|nr:MAG: hypothetical protein EOP11_23500 [Pseudomonadota bacterium]